MKLMKWRIMGLVMVAIFIAAQAQQARYTITRAQSGKNYLNVNSTSIELDGSKFAEYVMALFSTSVPVLSNYSFEGIGQDGVRVRCSGCSGGGSGGWKIEIRRNYADPNGTAAEVAVGWWDYTAPIGGKWIYLFNTPTPSTPAEILKFDYAVSTIIQLILGATSVINRQINVSYYNNNRDFELEIRE